MAPMPYPPWLQCPIPHGSDALWALCASPMAPMPYGPFVLRSVRIFWGRFHVWFRHVRFCFCHSQHWPAIDRFVFDFHTVIVRN